MDSKSVLYTNDQLKAIKTIVEYSENFADVLYNAIIDHGLDKTFGCHLRIEISPEYNFVTKIVEFGKIDTPAGFIHLSKGKEEKAYVQSGSLNSPEYCWLFATEDTRRRIREVLKKCDPVPTDSVWLRGDADDSALDSGVSVDGLADSNTDS